MFNDWHSTWEYWRRTCRVLIILYQVNYLWQNICSMRTINISTKLDVMNCHTGPMITNTNAELSVKEYTYSWMFSKRLPVYWANVFKQNNKTYIDLYLNAAILRSWCQINNKTFFNSQRNLTRAVITVIHRMQKSMANDKRCETNSKFSNTRSYKAQHRDIRTISMWILEHSNTWILEFRAKRNTVITSRQLTKRHSCSDCETESNTR